MSNRETAIFAILSLLSPMASFAAPMDASVYNANNAKLNSCFVLDTNGDLKPNTKEAGCKIITSKPGANESVVVVETSLNVGTFGQPKERPTRMEVKITKENGKAVAFEQKVTDLSTDRVDTLTFDVTPDRQLKNPRLVQNGAKYALVSEETCKPLTEMALQYGVAKVAECTVIAQKAYEPLSKIVAELAKSKTRLGTIDPSNSTPSLAKANTVTPQKLKDVFAVLAICNAYAIQEASKPRPEPSNKSAAPASAPAQPQTKPAGTAQ